MTEETTLEPCPWCNSNEYLFVPAAGSLTPDMPARPYQVICVHIDHDTVRGPVAYGKEAARIAWNTRATTPAEAERKAIIDWLRSEAAMHAFREETCSEDMETEIGLYRECLSDAADAISRGEHLKGPANG